MATAQAGKKLYTSLLDPLAFPPFEACPEEHAFVPTYYGQREVKYSASPTKHWCFLGEIESISGMGRLCLDVKDREGVTVRIYFYLDRLSPSVVSVYLSGTGITYPQHSNLPQRLIKEGNTIAVLYAERHRWLAEASTGIRIEDGDVVQVCD